MQINIENLVSISEANQNFSKVARLADTNGTVVILKNNIPKYAVVSIEQLKTEIEKTVVEEPTLNEVATSLLLGHLDAFKELSK